MWIWNIFRQKQGQNAEKSRGKARFTHSDRQRRRRISYSELHPNNRAEAVYQACLRAGNSRQRKKKKTPGKEHLLGVEGIPDDIILRAVQHAGATVLDAKEESQLVHEKRITKSTLYFAGLSGGAGSAACRKKLLEKLELPSNLSANALIDYCNCMFSEQEFLELVNSLK